MELTLDSILEGSLDFSSKFSASSTVIIDSGITILGLYLVPFLAILKEIPIIKEGFSCENHSKIRAVKLMELTQRTLQFSIFGVRNWRIDSLGMKF